MEHIFISNPFRSGSSLISRMLNAHSQIGMTVDKIKYFLFCYNPNIVLTKDNVEELLNSLAGRIAKRFNILIDPYNCLNNLKNEINYKNLYSNIFNEVFKGTKKKITGEMEVMAWRSIPDFLEMFPKGKALMIIRDPRDVVVSFKKKTFAPGYDYLVALFNCIDAMDHSLRYKKQFPDRFLPLRFEKIKANPGQEMKKVCEFLGVVHEPSMIKEENWMEGDKPWINHQVSSFYKDGDFQNPVGRWLRVIQPEDLFLIEWIGREQIRKFGIKPECNEVSQKTFDLGVKKLNSSLLLRECFKNWCETGTGVQRYP